MEQISPKDRRSLIHPIPFRYELKVPKVDSTSGKLYAGKYEPLDQTKLDSKIYELDACLKNGLILSLLSLLIILILIRDCLMLS